MECPYIPELSYGEFRQKLTHILTDQRHPIKGSLELTFRCNLRCKHCYVACGHTGIPGKDELSYTEIQHILDELVDAGSLWLLLTGGEPLMRRDFTDIYLYAKNKGLLITLFTNGTMLTPRIADLLAEYRPFNVEITLYGATQETYERVTGIPGSYSRCMRGIDLLLEREIPLTLKSMVFSLNKHEIAGMKQIAQERGLKYRYDTMINAGVNGAKDPIPLRLSPEEVVQIDLEDPARVEEFREFFVSHCGSPSPNQNNRLYTCGAGLRSFHIDPYGNLSLCMMARQPHFNLRSGPFLQGWDEFIPQVRQQKPSNGYECGDCRLLPLCGQCPGWSQLEHNNSETRVDYLCQVTHKRVELLELMSLFSDSVTLIVQQKCHLDH